MCVCVCVCVCMYTYVYLCVCNNTIIHVYMYISVYSHSPTHHLLLTFPSPPTSALINRCLHVHVHIYIHVLSLQNDLTALGPVLIKSVMKRTGVHVQEVHVQEVQGCHYVGVVDLLNA